MSPWLSIKKRMRKRIVLIELTGDMQTVYQVARAKEFDVLRAVATTRRDLIELHYNDPLIAIAKA
jgi:hypothetical protein